MKTKRLVENVFLPFSVLLLAICSLLFWSSATSSRTTVVGAVSAETKHTLEFNVAEGHFAQPQPTVCDSCVQISVPLPSLAPPARATIKSKADLWSGGTVLRGVNIWQAIQKHANINGCLNKDDCGKTECAALMDTRYDVASFRNLRNEWKANYLNISHAGIYSEKPIRATDSREKKYRLIEGVFCNLKRLVAEARAAELFVVVSFRTGPGRSERQFDDEDERELIKHLFETRNGNLTEKAVEAQNAWAAMWRDAAKELKNYPNVVGYDLMVEPGTKYENLEAGDNRNLWFALAGKIAEIIRRPESEGGAGDCQTPILVGGTNYSNACSLSCLRPADFHRFKPVVFTAHQYEPDEYTHQANDFADYDCRQNKSKKNKNEKPVFAFDEKVRKTVADRFAWMNGFKQQHSVRVAVNEYGSYRWAGVEKNAACKPGENCGDSDSFFNYETDLLERLGANHALWLWETSDCTGYDAFNFRHGQNPRNHIPVPDDASMPPAQRDRLIKAIKDNWAKNTVFANSRTLAEFADDDCPAAVR